MGNQTVLLSWLIFLLVQTCAFRSQAENKYLVSLFRQHNANPNYENIVPTEADYLALRPLAERLYRDTSPIFLSRRDGNGALQRGLQSVPTGISGRPVLLVGNHQFLGNFPRAIIL